MFEVRVNRYFHFAGYGLLAFWLIVVGFILLLETTPLELNNDELQTFVYLTAVFGLPVVLTFWLSQQFRLSKAKTFIVVFCFLVSLLLVSAINFGLWFASAKLSVWKTVSIEYRLKNNPQVTLARQMKDVGALGYRRRFVRTVELTSFLSYTVPVDKRSATETGEEWTRVEESKDPFGWKGV